jgi:formylmethanofuran dehydrogenase subunit D
MFDSREFLSVVCVPSLKNSAILPKTKATARPSYRHISCHINFIKKNGVMVP